MLRASRDPSPAKHAGSGLWKQTMTTLDHNLIHRFNVGDALRRSAARSPLQRAIHFQGRELNYAELDRLANQMARKLMASGISQRDTVAILATNSPEYVAGFFGW